QTARVVMAAAPSLTVTFSQCRLGASRRAGSSDCALIPTPVQGEGRRRPPSPAAPTKSGNPCGDESGPSQGATLPLIAEQAKRTSRPFQWLPRNQSGDGG
ncbi:hypothetical protein H1C71_010537, partial [Ictidomys tridecemlineatus]